jgi:hypothetical protein
MWVKKTVQKFCNKDGVTPLAFRRILTTLACENPEVTGLDIHVFNEEYSKLINTSVAVS